MAQPKKKRSRKNRMVPHQISQLETAIAGVRGNQRASPRTWRKRAEEATEIVIEAVRSKRAAVVAESVDLICNLVVLCSIKLRHYRGPVFTVPFSLLGAVENMSRDWVIEKIAIGVTYDSTSRSPKKLGKCQNG
jgi:hypothetical protein